MNGWGIVKGLGVTFKHFINTYLDDLRWLGKPRYSAERVADRSSLSAKGAFTVQYPDEKLLLPEEFRYIPFLIYDEGPNGEKQDRCTSCGICAKVCPPQCIWIVRTNDPVTGKPVPAPAEFYIDVDICMNCGLCAEYCPFDAIKMDHDFEIASYDRFATNIYDKTHLSKPASYYASIRPTNNQAEEIARAEKEAAKVAALAARKASGPPVAG
ncbi:MAG: 4Fe-4S binding protein [Anaerolineaceae bacterium]|nr:4Fe-4S binding protein [Anaerolineaceae bacterium]